MGTSSIYGGYSNGGSQHNPLIPADFDFTEGDQNTDGEIEETNSNEDNELSTINNPLVSWKDAKTFMSKLASGKSNNIGGAISNYVKAHGGAKSASKNAVGGIRTTIRLGSFINSVSTQGIKETLSEYKIDFNNKSVKEILSELINVIAPSPNTKEDAIARKSLVLTMEMLYVLIEKEKLEVDSIEKLDLNIVIPIYIESYIYEKLINDLGSRIEAYAKNASQAVELEKDIKDYIHAKIEIVFKGKEIKDYIFSDKEILKIYRQCYTVMEDLI
ncbi:hypothetical protein [Myroides odoratus]|uniref:Uncharacterized protein n=1 Tax=Myroides odoratus TaxID=256 RepID=A0A378RML9_MYROD|nr:hypothetical protein [Myroides odoratus]QQU02192.1 hypothetical protein I6I89_09930 [Myroides odoratus]STZ26900.1 Uncharacterised protein [Myroides odoratus]